MAVATGCASNRQPPPVYPAGPVSADEAKAQLTLAAITPVPKLAPAGSQPTSRPSMAAVELFARARDLYLKNQPQAAIDLLRQAIALDPYRFDLRYELGLAYVAAGNADDEAITSFEKAAALDPDHLDLQTELGRLYLSKGETEAALPHLRLAIQTTDYSTDDGAAAVADYLLARTLRQLGYDRAALDQYVSVLHRLANPTTSLRQNTDLGVLIDRVETLYIQIGELLEKHGDYDQAVKAFEPAADHEPENFELQARVARDLARLNRRQQALQKSVDLIVRDQATPASIEVLRDVCRILNIHKGEIAELKKLSRSRPNNQAVLFALADTLLADDRALEAVRLLESAWQRSRGDVRLARRLFGIYRQTNEPNTSAAQLLIATLAQNPDALSNLEPLWLELFQANRPGRLTIESVSAISVPAAQQPAKYLLIAIQAGADERPGIMRSSIDRATRLRPIFEPAFREAIVHIWTRPDLTPEQQKQTCDQLIGSLPPEGSPALAEELRGRVLVAQGRNDDAAKAFASAEKLGGRSPGLKLAGIESRRLKGHDARYEQDLWKLTADFPMFEDGYLALFRYYAAPGTASLEQVNKVLTSWLQNDPQSVPARIAQARLDAKLGQTREAETQLLRLFAEDPDDEGIYAGLSSYYTEQGRVDKLVLKLEEACASRPRDVELVGRLVNLYVEQKRKPDAVRLLDTTRAAVTGDADLLYSVASLYSSMDQKQTAEDLLVQVIESDPAHAAACNDLGFQWANDGRNLSDAETLIRRAVEAEPDNQSFLDSLGWVLYKRGQFEQARKQLELAVGPVPDPAVLDHLGDTLYRLTRADDAKQTWQQSLKGLGDRPTTRDDLKQLRLQLLQKIRQVEAKRPVDVAPALSTSVASTPLQTHVVDKIHE